MNLRLMFLLWFFFHLDKNTSFLVYQTAIKLCLYPRKPSTHMQYVTVGKCDPRKKDQHWIWTKNKQLLNLFTLKCLEVSDNYIGLLRLVLNICNASNLRQLWQCEGKDQFFLYHTKLFMEPRSQLGNIYVRLFRTARRFGKWKRYELSNQSLCSRISSYNGTYIIY